MKKISFSILSHEELLTISTSMSHVLSPLLKTDAYLGQLNAIIKKVVKDLSVALGKDMTSDWTELVKAKDIKRDRAFIGFRDFVKACTNSPELEVQVAAGNIIKVINNKGWTLYKEGYASQSARLDSLFEELETEEGRQALVNVKAEDWYNNLKQAHGDFLEGMQGKTEEEAKDDIPWMSKSRRKLYKYLKALLSYLEMQAELVGDQYAEVARQVDEIVGSAMAVARARQTREANENELAN